MPFVTPGWKTSMFLSRQYWFHFHFEVPSHHEAINTSYAVGDKAYLFSPSLISDIRGRSACARSDDFPWDGLAVEVSLSWLLDTGFYLSSCRALGYHGCVGQSGSTQIPCAPSVVSLFNTVGITPGWCLRHERADVPEIAPACACMPIHKWVLDSF